MDHGTPETFGTPSQAAMQARSWALWRLLRGDARFCCYGRGVAVASAEAAEVGDQIAVARLIGACACEDIPADAFGPRKMEVEAAGLGTDSYASWVNGPGALTLAEALCADRPLPEGLSLRVVDATTPAADMAALDALTGSCGVLLPMGAFLRGQVHPAVCVGAFAEDGTAVACAASVALHHAEGASGDVAWWGMLATRESHRGAGLALRMGAEALCRMRDRHGKTLFFTGIRAGNAASEALCRKLGFAPDSRRILIAIDAGVLGSAQVTR